jgi:hypothetical protein
MDPKLATNLANAHKMASNWVMTAVGAMATIWFLLPADQQATVIAHLPVPLWSLPIVTSIIGIAARVWPQKSITPAVAEAKSADAPQPPTS